MKVGVVIHIDCLLLASPSFPPSFPPPPSLPPSLFPSGLTAAVGPAPPPPLLSSPTRNAFLYSMMRNEKARCEEKSPNPRLPLAEVVYSLTLRVNWAAEAPLFLPLINRPGEFGAGGRAATAPADFLKGKRHRHRRPSSSAFPLATASPCSASRGNGRPTELAACARSVSGPSSFDDRCSIAGRMNGATDRGSEGRRTAFLRCPLR